MIIQFVVKTLPVAMLISLNPQAVSWSISAPLNSPHHPPGGEIPRSTLPTMVTGRPSLVSAPRALGHAANLAEQSAGLGDHPQRGGLAGGADPRREGAVMGDDA